MQHFLIQMSFLVTEMIDQAIFIGGGVLITLEVLLGAIFIGITLGTFFAVLRHNKICHIAVTFIISIIRGTPLILQLSFIYFAIPSIIGIKCSIVTAGIIAFGLNSAAYVAEILRSGIENLPKGQFEAAKTLQIPAFNTWKDIILPQVVKNILPSMISEIITLLKETALIGTIGAMDIMRKSQILAAEKFTFFMPLCIAGAYYYIMVIFIEHLGAKAEKHFAYNN